MSFFSDKFTRIFNELQGCDYGSNVAIRTNDTYIVWCLTKGRLDYDKANAQIVNRIADLLVNNNIRVYIDFTGHTDRMFGDTLELYETLAKDYAKLEGEHITIDVQRDFAWGGGVTFGRMELDWQDIREIVKVADDVLTRETKYHFTNEKEYYEQVLRRLKAGSNKSSYHNL